MKCICMLMQRKIACFHIICYIFHHFIIIIIIIQSFSIAMKYQLIEIIIICVVIEFFPYLTLY